MLALIQCYMSNKNSTTSSSHNEDGSTSLYKNTIYRFVYSFASCLVENRSTSVHFHFHFNFAHFWIKSRFGCLFENLFCKHASVHSHKHTNTLDDVPAAAAVARVRMRLHTAHSTVLECGISPRSNSLKWQTMNNLSFAPQKLDTICKTKREREHMRTFVENNSTISR